MNVEKIIQNALVAQKAERMMTSEQLTLNELILLLSAVQDKSKPLVFDYGFFPVSIGSWRGIYAHLAIQYAKIEETKLNIETVAKWILRLQCCLGAEFEGYKGGTYIMGKQTPIWVANYGETRGFKSDEENELWYQAIIGVEEKDDATVLLTATMDT
jgi:hypothetical protein